MFRGPLGHAPRAGKKVAFLDERRFDETVLDFATQCQRYDGSPLTINQPQGQQGARGHETYEDTAPISATTKLVDMQELEAEAAIDPGTGGPKNVDASMLLRRLKVYTYNVRVQKPAKFKQCARCFASFVLNQACEGAA